MKISMDRKYRTVDGRPVIIHEIKEEVWLPPTASNPEGEVIRPTYPVKGTVVNKRPKRGECNIWSIEGKVDVVWGHYSHLNLVEDDDANK